MNCTFDVSYLKILSLNNLPESELATLVSECLCMQVYKNGSADLTGIGVIVALLMQLIIAIFFWIVGWLDEIAIPVIWKSYSPRSYLQWVTNHHGTCLWTQLVITFTLCLAGLIRETQRADITGVYESASILDSIIVSLLSLYLTTLSFFPDLCIVNGNFRFIKNGPKKTALFRERTVFFYVSSVMTTAFGLFAILITFWGAQMENLLQQCADFADRENLPWKAAAIKPMHGNGSGVFVTEYISTTSSALLSLVLWFSMRLLSTNEQIQPPKWRRVFVILITGLSIYLIYEACKSFGDLLNERQGMDLLWKDQIGQNVWGIGQIAAPLSWAPLIVDMAFGLIEQCNSKSDKEEDTKLYVYVC
ncbi:hypothetical protein BGZ60DRAFT_532755 [Tricladium varicosporioides]|nr:hypothetical protein BGZ60DRAFT_532755 [Hymenoscyphus varicosporioides]